MTDGVPAEPGEAAPPGVDGPAILVSVFLIATCGLIYELVAAALASYLLGDSVTQFSTVIGAYLSAMGLGAWLSRWVVRRVARRFVEIELAVGLLGGFSAAILFLSFAGLPYFRMLLYGLVGVIGTLVGLEIPLLMRILKDRYDTRELVARVLSVDYLGALAASLFFPLFLVPKLGLVRGALVVGTLNAIVALWSTFLLKSALTSFERRWLRVQSFVVLLLLGVGITFAESFTSLAEDEVYADTIVYTETSPYQRIVLTRGKSSFSLFLNGNLQFASADEHRYHEALVHPVFAATSSPADVRNVLVLGGGDGLAVREVLKYPSVEAVRLVDLDPAMTKLARSHPLLVQQNESALLDPRVELVHQDAFLYLDHKNASTLYDVVIVDFPDPNNFSLGKLYTRHFYRKLTQVLAPGGAIAIQATSPLLARKSFWMIVNTLASAELEVRAYHANVPSFGEWGYVLATKHPIPETLRLRPGLELRYLTDGVLNSLFEFGADVGRVDLGVNRLDNQLLVHTYESEWSRWY